MTLRDLYNITAAARGHWVIYGTPQRIADTFEEWFGGGLADGFIIMPAYFPARSTISSISSCPSCNGAGSIARIIPARHCATISATARSRRRRQRRAAAPSASKLLNANSTGAKT